MDATGFKLMPRNAGLKNHRHIQPRFFEENISSENLLNFTVSAGFS
jgi:hypothetical protein